MMLGLSGCGDSADSGDDAAADGGSRAEASTGNATSGGGAAESDPDPFVEIKLGDQTIRVATAVRFTGMAMEDRPVSITAMGGWVNVARATASRQEEDEDARQREAMRSFGTYTVYATLASDEPGDYTLVADKAEVTAGSGNAFVQLPADEDLGVAGEWTSQSGSLTLKSLGNAAGSSNVVRRLGSGVLTARGTFAMQDGQTREVTVTIYVPED
jgi:hypothetical protein